MTNNIFFIIICFYDGTLKGNEKLQVWVLFSKKRENEEKHGKNFSDDKLNQTNYILYICGTLFFLSAPFLLSLSVMPHKNPKKYDQNNN